MFTHSTKVNICLIKIFVLNAAFSECRQEKHQIYFFFKCILYLINNYTYDFKNAFSKKITNKKASIYVKNSTKLLKN